MSEPARALAAQGGSGSVVFAELTGGSSLFEELGDEEAHALIVRVLEALQGLVARLTGRSVGKLREGILCTFPAAAPAVDFATRAQRGLSGRERRVELKIGINFGPLVTDSEGDPSGDTVNVAGRLCELASPRQIITTQATIDAMPFDTRLSTRRLGSHRLEGLQRRVELVEVLWEDHLDHVTMMPRGPQPEMEGTPRVLRLTFHGSRMELSTRGRSHELQLGRDPENLLVVADDSVSRRHATIEVRNGKFYLRDHSTNGTYLRSQDGLAVVVRRESVPLHGRGAIALGADFEEAADDAILFEIAEARRE